MNRNKKGSTNNLICSVCKIDFSSNADYALHEFSKKHCDNLIRLAKKKPIINKQKNKTELSQEEKESPKVDVLTQTGSFAKYGYFVPGKIYALAESSKEFDTDYDPYLQKFATNPFKEKPAVLAPSETASFCSVATFNKKKKKKSKTCQVCNITTFTVPEYEAHMKSPQHLWKLKITGMGVSAHFVKASTDLHTIDVNGETKSSNQTSNEQTPASTVISNENLNLKPFPLLYCSDCELLLNSLQQYNAHINGKLHIECAQKKAELKAKKEKLENPSPNQLYCYSCKISLNNIFQYNEHKNGKKHKTKCRNLVKKGITIPPEERVPGIPFPNSKYPVIYPELYEKLILEKQKQEIKSEDLNTSADFSPSLNHCFEHNVDIKGSLEYPKDKRISMRYSENPANNLGIQNENNPVVVEIEKSSSSLKEPKIVFHKNCANPLADTSVSNDNNLMPEINNSQMNIPNSQVNCSNDLVKPNEKELSNQITIIVDNKPVKCSICNENFLSQLELDVHLETEAHLNKILELKTNGGSENEILKALLSDRNTIKPSSMGKLSCSICTVVADSDVEFYQHLNSIVHKYTLKDYKMKRTLEVKHIKSKNEQGLHFCKLCQEGWSSLLEYTHHLHSMKHKNAQRAQRAKIILAKRRISYLQRQRLKSFGKKNISLRIIKKEKNPGVRTKVCGKAFDLQSGIQAPVPNLESLESKIDLTKNASIGICEKRNDKEVSNNNNNNNSYINNNINNNNSNNNNDNHDDDNEGEDKDNDKLKVAKIKKARKIGRPNCRKLQDLVPNQINNCRFPHNVPSFVPPGNLIPPLLPCSSYQPRFSRPSYVPTNRNWVPFSSHYASIFEPFFGRTPARYPYIKPTWFPRPPWPKYR